MKFCPKCGIALDRKKVRELTAEGCPKCGGIWLDKIAWEQVRNDLDGALELERVFVDYNPMPVIGIDLLCPQCNLALQPFRPMDAPNMEFDFCSNCGGLWLEDGELGKLIQVLRQHRPTTKPIDKDEEVQLTFDWVQCAECGRENFPDAEECWACGKPLTPMPPVLPAPLQFIVELTTMLVGGTGAVLFALFITRPGGEKLAGLGLGLLLLGVLGLGAIRRVWKRPGGSGFFPTYSGQ